MGDLGINFVLDMSASSAAPVGLEGALDDGAVLAAVGAGRSAVAETSAVALHLRGPSVLWWTKEKLVKHTQLRTLPRRPMV